MDDRLQDLEKAYLEILANFNKMPEGPRKEEERKVLTLLQNGLNLLKDATHKNADQTGT